jgi:hypothetical protein
MRTPAVEMVVGPHYGFGYTEGYFGVLPFRKKKEQEVEAHLFGDKPVYVTNAYRKHQEEQAKYEAELNKRCAVHVQLNHAACAELLCCRPHFEQNSHAALIRCE